MKNVVLIGYGNIAKKHEIAIQAINSIKLLDVVDPFLNNPGLDSIRVFSSLDEYVKQPNRAHIAAICTPNYLHAQQAIQCMEAGMHVLIEKPMAISKVDAEKIIATSLETDTKVFCVMQLRYSPVVSWLKKLVDQNLLGDIYSIESRCFWNRGDAYYLSTNAGYHWRGKLSKDKGPLYTQFSHFVDIIYHLFGAWEVQHATFNNFNHRENTEFEDSGHVLFKTGNIQGIFSYTTAVFEKNFESTITILGSKGTVSIGGQYFNQIRYCNPTSLPRMDEESLALYNDDKCAGHKMMYKNVLDVLLAKKPITTNALDGLKIVEMIEDVYSLRI